MSAKRVAKVKSILKTVIRSVCRKKQMFVKDPKRDFTRERKGYRLLAADGSDIHVAANPLDPASYFPGSNGQTAPFSVVRLELSEDNFEVIITNLDADEFPPDELKRLFAMRWGIETSFRDLKYTLGLSNFHAKKAEYIFQEIFSRLIMYNFCRLVTSEIAILKKQRKYEYQINFHAAVQLCRQFLLGKISPPVLEADICRYLSPFRPGRSRLRKHTVRNAVNFIYRVA